MHIAPEDVGFYIQTAEPMDTTFAPQPVSKRTYSIAEVAEALDVSERTIRNRIKDGALPAIKPGREYIITRSDLVEWLGGEERVDDIFGPLEERH